MRKLVLFLALLIGGFAQAQNNEIEDVFILDKQNNGLMNTLNDLPMEMRKAEFKTIDTILQKEVVFHFSFNSYKKEVEIYKFGHNIDFNYFLYQDGELKQAGELRPDFGDKIGLWYYFSENYYFEVHYKPDKTRGVDSIFDPDDPHIIILIDTVYYFEIAYPIVKYELKTGIIIESLSEEQVKSLAVKEEEVKEVLKALGVSINTWRRIYD